MNIERLVRTRLSRTVKGIPDLREESIALADIPKRRWNLLAGDLPIPVATIDRDRLLSNSRWMRSFTERHHIQICPHGKTTMAPQLFKLQIDDGAWGISVASVQQMRVCRDFGIKRVLMANQLVGDAEIQEVIRTLNGDPDFDFYCLVDSIENVSELHGAARRFRLSRPLQVLLEGGVPGGRAGCRRLEDAIELAIAIRECGPQIALRGIEGFEGVIDHPEHAHNESAVIEFMEFLSRLFERAAELCLFAEGKPIFSVGGSIYFDLVALHPHILALRDRCEVVLRSGCYLTHDSRMLTDNFDRVRARTPELGSMREGLQPALKLWGRIQSMPEPGLAIINLGKRDASFDVDLPIAEEWFRRSIHAIPTALTEPVAATQINDQHMFLTLSPSSQLRVGDLIGFGVSHPCTTFDKWRLLYVIDNRYDVVEGILTFF